MVEPTKLVGLAHVRVLDDASEVEAWFETAEGPLLKTVLTKQAASGAAAKLTDVSLRLSNQRASPGGVDTIHALPVALASAQPVPASDQVMVQMVMGGTGTSALFLVHESIALVLAAQIVGAVQSQRPSDSTPRQ